ncbi:hypothetical protein HIM_08626 [Hirsutella minnesotensis 3608]|uniref:RNA-dependent RNA polymerase n=1 Tax=Hirsutella minnesotensis 3608 TaxID=1043627 RepID=A0A0F7ZH34_9HYPO|nr:hypothetical protein HIM_08626 [Hirsutella minnesotensis 3608]
MEVYLKNVPGFIPNESLHKELEPWMNTLGILDWNCEKARRRDIAWITFLQESDGRNFLQKHQEITIARAPPTGPAAGVPFKSRNTIARLHILGSAVYVSRSKRAVDENILSHLGMKREERTQSPRQRAHPAVKCRLLGLACGKNVFSDTETLTFAEQTSVREAGYAKFGHRCLTIKIYDDNVRMDVPYETMQDLVVNLRGPILTLVLTEPPRFFCKAPTQPLPYGVVANPNRWERKSSVPIWHAHSKYVAHCLVYQLAVHPGDAKVIRELRDQDNPSVTMQDIAIDTRPAPYTLDYTTSMRAFEGSVQKAGMSRLLPHPLLFQLEGLIWNNYLHPASATKMLDIMIKTASESNRARKEFPFTAESMKQLLVKIPYPCPGTEPSEFDPQHLVDLLTTMESENRQSDPSRSGVYGRSIPNQQTWVFKAMVTPTRIMLQGPDAESKNRVLRMFPDHADHFLRVSFTDENGQDMSISPKISHDEVYERYRDILRQGIRIAGRHYVFLGFSHSSLRSHSTWFMAPFVDSNMQRQDYDTILRQLGDFSEIRVAAKCAARIGQAFSETPYAVDLVNKGIMSRSIADVKSADGTRVFSDGVGTISRGAVDEICKELSGMRTAEPTCFQVRWGGVKGMLSLDSRLPGKVINVREESMMKFPSGDRRELGICDAATRPLRLMLNRQLIKILEDMGTDGSWFLDLQTKALKMLRAVTRTASNTSTFLQYQDMANVSGMPTLIRQLDKMGIDYRRDDFMRSVVEHVVLRELRLLKHKARIPVDLGVTLFGIMDETGFLQEGEVYITYDRSQNPKRGNHIDPSLRDGLVIVTRCPALHPGDVQVVQMRTPPSGHPLRDLRNCIVFSQHGARDLPSCLSGGDLDGDLYNVIWDPLARPKVVFGPADYPRTRPPELDRPVTRDDIADFFIKFMKTDILGLIANRHQILADVSDQGTVDGKCVQLAEMHSTAVDFSKTGIPVNAIDMPKPPRTRPDFMAPAPPVKLYDLGQIDFIDEAVAEEDDEDGMGSTMYKYHKSQKILGRLYRGVDEKKIWYEDIHTEVNTQGPSVWEQLKGRIRAEMASYGIELDHKHQEKEAWRIRNLYDGFIAENMWHYSENPRAGITEVEAFCGTLLNKRGSQTRQQRDQSVKLKEATDRIMTLIINQIRKRGDGKQPSAPAYDDEDSDSESTATDSRNDILQLCWACVVVGCMRDPKELYGDGSAGSELRSFRVVAAACLLKEASLVRGRHAYPPPVFDTGYAARAPTQAEKELCEQLKKMQLREAAHSRVPADKECFGDIWPEGRRPLYGPPFLVKKSV